MGNKPIADRISSASKVKQVSTFNLENLIDDSVLETIYEQFKSGSGVYVNDDEAYKEDFTEFNEQEKQSNTDLIKDRVIQEINEAITTGFSTPGFFMEELKEPRFEKYFQVNERGDSGEYFKRQYKKFFIMYIYYKVKTQDMEVTKKDFYESLESYFGQVATSEDLLEFDTNIRFSLNLMKEVGKTNPKMLIASLKSLHQSFVSSPCEVKRDVTRFDYYAEEKLFVDLRSFLIQLIKDPNSVPLVQELCIKLILLIGNIRGSGEDFLIVYNLINEYKFEFNVDVELSQCKFIETSAEGSADAAEELKVSYEGSKFSHILKGGDLDFEFSTPTNMVFDKDFIYAFQRGKGLYKLGLSDSVSTKLGSLYWRNTSLSDNSGAFLHLNDKLYYRSSNSDEKPFVLIDKETLEEVTENEEFNKKVESLKPKKEDEGEGDKAKEEDEKKPEVEEDNKEDPNELHLGWTKVEDDDEDMKDGRYL